MRCQTECCMATKLKGVRSRMIQWTWNEWVHFPHRLIIISEHITMRCRWIAITFVEHRFFLLLDQIINIAVVNVWEISLKRDIIIMYLHNVLASINESWIQMQIGDDSVDRLKMDERAKKKIKSILCRRYFWDNSHRNQSRICLIKVLEHWYFQQKREHFTSFTFFSVHMRTEFLANEMWIFFLELSSFWAFNL